jgi:hypothetical protein
MADDSEAIERKPVGEVDGVLRDRYSRADARCLVGQKPRRA